MGLVDYSESESDSEAPAKQPPQKPTFQKIIDRSNRGKIVVNLAQPTPTTTDEPPSKRARTSPAGGGLFAGFNSFLPPPRNTNPPAPKPSSRPRPPPGLHLKTSAEVGFSRDQDDSEPPPPPKELKEEEEVKLVGKPLMFKPLSVARNNKPKPKPKPSNNNITKSPPPAPAPKPAKLFSLHVEEPRDTAPSPTYGSEYPTGPQHPLEEPQYPTGPDDSETQEESLRSVADELNLSAAARRELFGRGGQAGKVLTFNMDKEYMHNEQVRASGEQLHNPIRAIQGGGKHSLRQLVHNVVNQRDALEDSFAKGKSNRKEASNKYGW